MQKLEKKKKKNESRRNARCLIVLLEQIFACVPAKYECQIPLTSSVIECRGVKIINFINFTPIAKKTGAIGGVTTTVQGVPV